MQTRKKTLVKSIALVWLGVTIFILSKKMNEMVLNTIDTSEALHTLPRTPGDDVDSACTRHFDNDTVHVVIMADERDFIGMLTLANSIFRNSRSDVIFHFVTFPRDVSFLEEWLSTGDLRYLSHEIIEVSREELDGKFKVRSPRKDLANPMNFVRIYLPDLLPCLSRVIFIDADCLVLGDISELYHTEIAPRDVVAGVNVCEFGTRAVLEQVLNYSNPHVQVAGIPPQACMMNGGVFVADLVKWEQQHVSQDLHYWMELNTREPVFLFGDHGAGTQAILNAVLHSKYTPLPKEWNTVSRGHSKTPNPKLIHWNGFVKPWKHQGAFSEQWIKYFVPDPKNRYIVVIKNTTKD